MDHATYREWIDLEVEGVLGDAETAALAAHLEGCAACRGEREQLCALARTIEVSRVAVRPGFRAAVMQALPPTGWEARAPRAWALPAVLFAVLGGAAAVLLGTSTARAGAPGPLLGALSAIVDLLGAALLAGSGLAAATWRGLGLALGEVLSASRGSLVAALLLVVALNWLLLRLLRRPAEERDGRRRP
jgi:hypothetical protein